MKRLIKVLLVLLIGINLMGCSNSKQPKDVVIEYIKNLKKEAQQEILNNINEDTKEQLTKYSDLAISAYQLLSDFDYSVVNENTNEDKATVEIEFKTYDFKTAVGEFVGEIFVKAFALAFSGGSEEDLNNAIETMLNEKVSKLKEQGKTIVSNYTFELSKVDDEWKIDTTTDNLLGDIITGGLVSALNNLNALGN